MTDDDWEPAPRLEAWLAFFGALAFLAGVVILVGKLKTGG